MAMQKVDSSLILPQRQAEAYAKGRGPKEAANATPVATDGRSGGSVAPAAGDRAEISASARDLIQLRAAVDTGRSALAEAPEVREDRVVQARQRLAAGFYQSAEVRLQVADQLRGVFSGLDSL